MITVQTCFRDGEETTVAEDTQMPNRPRLVSSHHHRRSLTMWLVPLAIIIAIMVFLPRLTALWDK
jgi:hypothetical protein